MLKQCQITEWSDHRKDLFAYNLATAQISGLIKVENTFVHLLRKEKSHVHTKFFKDLAGNA